MARRGLVALACAALACSDRPARNGAATDDTSMAAIGQPQSALASWVDLYDPESAWNGFTLALYRKQTPILIDMGGRLVHAWPEVRARSRIRLLDDCSLLAIASSGHRVQRYGWEGELLWEAALEPRLPHHDLIRLGNGNVLAVVLREEEKTDDLLELDRSGEIVWEWRAGEHLAEWIARTRKRGRANVTHINSVQELPPNPWHDAGDTRFRPGNLLLSARNLDALFVIDRRDGAVVWSLDEGLDQQHEALMNGPGLPAPGYIQLFNNNTYTTRRSAVLELDPRDLSVAWRYEALGFFSATKGSQQALPNGNVLIVSSRGWRAFEVTRAGRTVWQWTPPFEPQRPRRYGAGDCSRLAELGDPAAPPVEPPADYAYVDRELYAFTGSRDVVERGAGGRALSFVNRCRRLLLPPGARLEAAYGTRSDSGRQASAEFRAWLERLEPEAGPRQVALLADTLPLGTAASRSASLPLDPYGLERVRLCLSITGLGESEGAPVSRRAAVWERAEVVAAGESGAEPEEEAGLTAEELEERRRHLRAMGYVD